MQGWFTIGKGVHIVYHRNRPKEKASPVTLPGSVAGARVTCGKSTPTRHLPVPLGSFLYGTQGRFWHLSFISYRPPLSPDRVTTRSCREPTHKCRIWQVHPYEWGQPSPVLGSLHCGLTPLDPVPTRNPQLSQCQLIIP